MKAGKIAVALAGSSLAATAAWAGSQVEDTVSNCNAPNCGAIALRGVHQTNEPFVIQVFSAEGECLRLDVESQTQDTAMALLSPSANAIIANDDRDPGVDTRPLLFSDPMPTTGWYTVVISYWDWAPTQAKFIVKYGRYPTGNPNCSPAAAQSAAQLAPPAANPAKVKAPAAAGDDS